MNAVKIFIFAALILQLKNHQKYEDTHGIVLNVIQRYINYFFRPSIKECLKVNIILMLCRHVHRLRFISLKHAFYTVSKICYFK